MKLPWEPHPEKVSWNRVKIKVILLKLLILLLLEYTDVVMLPSGSKNIAISLAAISSNRIGIYKHPTTTSVKASCFLLHLAAIKTGLNSPGHTYPPSIAVRTLDFAGCLWHYMYSNVLGQPEKLLCTASINESVVVQVLTCFNPIYVVIKIASFFASAVPQWQ